MNQFLKQQIIVRLLALASCAMASVSAADADTGAAGPTRESAATLVVFNKQDPGSVELASYYAKRRSIPPEHVVGLDCSTDEEISRAQYDETIAVPLRKLFEERGWWHEPSDPSQPVTDNAIRFVALMRGIPVKIENTAFYAGDFPPLQKALSSNAAAVDSELATLGMRSRVISGPRKNIYYKSYTPFMDTPYSALMLVCRLDGPSVQTVEKMIDAGIDAERNGLDGFAYIDMRGVTSVALAIGDTWLADAANSLRQFGMPVVTDTLPDIFPVDYPMQHAAVYLGWYTENAAGPMMRDDFQFIPGAIAVHIHSYSGSSVRDPHGKWVGPLIAHGAAATLGNVYEPYLALTPNLDIFTDRLRNGYTFAEAGYASEEGLSWMTTFVGDPLYRPFENVDAAADTGTRPAIEYAAYRKGAREWFAKGRPAGEKQLKASAKELQSGIVWEGLGLLQWSVADYNAAVASFQNAEKCYGVSDDGLRTVLHQAAALKDAGRTGQARAIAGRALDRYRDCHGAQLLRAIIGLPAPGH